SKSILSFLGLVGCTFKTLKSKLIFFSLIYLSLSIGLSVEALALGEVCGDGVVGGQEACDDGNDFLGDGCTPACALDEETTGTARIHSIRLLRVGDDKIEAYFYFKPDANTKSLDYPQVTYPTIKQVVQTNVTVAAACPVSWSINGESGVIDAVKWVNGFYKAELPVSRNALVDEAGRVVNLLNYQITCNMTKTTTEKTTTTTMSGTRKIASLSTTSSSESIPYATKQLEYNPTTETFAHISISQDKNLINNRSGGITAISGEGDVIAFDSKATTLISGDAADSLRDVYEHELATGEIKKISGGNGANDNDAYYPAMSADGRYVAFATTNAEALDGGARSGFVDILVKDQETGAVERVSVSTSGGAINKTCYDDLSISGDGRFVAFRCAATNLVAGDTNASDDIFVRDRTEQKTFRVSVSSAGVQARGRSLQPVISLDGKFVAFASYASNLVSGDTNGKKDIFLYSIKDKTTTLVSVDPLASGEILYERRSPSISRDGRYVSYTVYKKAGTLARTDVSVYDRVSNSAQSVSADANKGADKSQLSADGRYVLFVSAATNLSPAVTTSQLSLYVRDRALGKTTLLGKAIPYGTFSASGEYISFWTNNSLTARKLVPWQTKPMYLEIFRMKNPVWVEQECGDGFVQLSEGCDDGGESALCDADCSLRSCGDNTINATAGETCDEGGETVDCDADCTASLCGDGVTNTTAGETCDDSGESATCDTDCTARSCGDGVINTTAGETCDDSGESATCDLDCTARSCGDGVTNLTAGEACDTGGETAECDADCSAVSCGDGKTNTAALEECDDGDDDDADECTNSCTSAICGDGIASWWTQPAEECDDENETSNDGCTACVSDKCGDGRVNINISYSNGVRVETTEQCDDYNSTPGDGCSANCTVETGFTCSTDATTLRSQCNTSCGDGVIAGAEQCDDRNIASGDGCSGDTYTCSVEEGWTCTGEPSGCTPVCGDNIHIVGVEACDDGDIESGDGCSASCVVEYCGDAIVNNGEACDYGSSGNQVCTSSCEKVVLNVDSVVGVWAGNDLRLSFHTQEYSRCQIKYGETLANVTAKEVNFGDNFNNHMITIPDVYTYGDMIDYMVICEVSGFSQEADFIQSARLTYNFMDPDIALVSITQGGELSNGTSFGGALGMDGKYVTFLSKATNMTDVATPTQTPFNILRKNTRNGAIEYIANAPFYNMYYTPYSYKEPRPIISADSRFMLYFQGDDYDNQLYVRGLSGQTEPELISIAQNGGLANRWSDDAKMDASGRFAIFSSSASNLTDEDVTRYLYTEDDQDIYIRDRLTGVTDMVTVTDMGTATGRDAEISADGSFVVYTSVTPIDSSDVDLGGPDVYIYNVSTKSNRLLTDRHEYIAGVSAPGVSLKGKYIVYTVRSFDGDHYAQDVFLRDINSDVALRVDVPLNEDNSTPWVGNSKSSTDGRYVFFTSQTQLYVYDRVNQVSHSVFKTPGLSSSIDNYDISSDGRYASIVVERAEQDLIPWLKQLAPINQHEVLRVKNPIWTQGPCGDGIVDESIEVCDDGNNINGDGCSMICTQELTCGNGRIDGSEECDDGNFNTGDSCTNTCTQAICGDGSVQAGVEACDDGDTDNDDACTHLCAVAECGDSFTQAGVESCDDANTASDDGCSELCALESGWICEGTLCQAAECGDNIIAGAEACDDGNETTEACTYGERECTVCDSVCQSVAGETSYCGDSVPQGSEACDDGDLDDGDECTNSCTNSTCGDGVLSWWLEEECDDKNKEPLDGCSVSCKREFCGDGVVNNAENGIATEVCDDGKPTALDGCSDTCTVEFGFTCTGAPSSCVSTCGDGDKASNEICDVGEENVVFDCGYTVEPETCQKCDFDCTYLTVESAGYCGDGFQDAAEECDDGNTDSDDGCSSTCKTEGCGDGVTAWWLGEECDAGSANSDTTADACRTTCMSATCGDGVVDSAEACDDGNLDSGDGCDENCTLSGCGNGILNEGEECDYGEGNGSEGCSVSCTFVNCGDGVKQEGEECDDGEANSDTAADACRTGCTSASCGDGVVDSGEACDDGNNVALDGCDAQCQEEVVTSLVINTVAGNGGTNSKVSSPLYSMQRDYSSTIGGQATQVPVTYPLDIAYDSIGDLYISASSDPTTNPFGDDRFGGVILKIEKATNIVTKFSEAFDSYDNNDFAINRLAVGADGYLYGVSYGKTYVYKYNLATGFKEQPIDFNTTAPANVTSSGLRIGDVVVDNQGNIFVTFWNTWSWSDPKGSVLRRDAGTGVINILRGVYPDGQQMTPRSALAYDKANNILYLASHGQIAKIDLDDGLTEDGDYVVMNATQVVAGSMAGGWGYSGDGGLASQAQVYVGDMAVGNSGDLYFIQRTRAEEASLIDATNTLTSTNPAFTLPSHSVRKIDMTTGIITTVAGTGQAGFSGDAGNPAQAQFSYPSGLAFDSQGRLTIADHINSRIRQVSTALTTCGNGILGSGEACDDGNTIDGDGCDSNCTVTACGNHIMTAGEECDDGNLADGDDCNASCQSTACGNGVVSYGETCDDHNLTDGDGCDSNCTTTRCGNGLITAGEECDDGNGNNGDGCTYDCKIERCGDGLINNRDVVNNVARETCDDGNSVNGDGCDNNCTKTGCGNGVISSGEECDDGNSQSLEGDGCDPNCTVTACGNSIKTTNEACDDGNSVNEDECTAACNENVCGDGFVNAVTPITDQCAYYIARIAGTGVQPTTMPGNGMATSIKLKPVLGVAVDSVGNIYFPEHLYNRIRKIDTSGNITTFAGTGSYGFYGDGGAATSARLDSPEGVAIDQQNNVYIADTYNGRIRKVNTSGTITTYAGSGVRGHELTDGQDALGAKMYPTRLAIDSLGNLYYVNKYSSNLIYKITNGKVYKVAGIQATGLSGDNGLATSAMFSTEVTGIAFDSSNNLYIADRNNYRIRKIDRNTGIITTVVGGGNNTFTDGARASTLGLGVEGGIAIDAHNNLYFGFGPKVYRVDLNTGRTIKVAGIQQTGLAGDGGLGINAKMYTPSGFGVDASGNVYVSDVRNYTIRRLSLSPNNADVTCIGAIMSTSTTEQCDDGNTADNDGCSASCGLESGWVCEGTSCQAAQCGDGIKAGTEACDDGNTASGDGCNSTCAIESGYTCAGTPSVCQSDASQNPTPPIDPQTGPDCASLDGATCATTIGCGWTGSICEVVEEDTPDLCGNGDLDDGEQCDDGNFINNDGCNNGCMLPECGDGVTNDSCMGNIDFIAPSSATISGDVELFNMLASGHYAYAGFKYRYGEQGFADGHTIHEVMFKVKGNTASTEGIEVTVCVSGALNAFALETTEQEGIATALQSTDSDYCTKQMLTAGADKHSVDILNLTLPFDYATNTRNSLYTFGQDINVFVLWPYGDGAEPQELPVAGDPFLAMDVTDNSPASCDGAYLETCETCPADCQQGDTAEDQGELSPNLLAITAPCMNDNAEQAAQECRVAFESLGVVDAGENATVFCMDVPPEENASFTKICNRTCTDAADCAGFGSGNIDAEFSPEWGCVDAVCMPVDMGP
ncbi:MAG: DUF4215 domain-containing protein, partial [Deltaproteobacteria bacterium]|nr:DUF4215 domain-containing protein [Deltaproteobacteria bacterium]